MIPRYAPTYTFADLWHALRQSLRGAVEDDLRYRLARRYGVKHVFLFDNARAGLYAVLKAYNRPGGVVLPAYTCIVVPEAVQHAGYTPVFGDIDCGSLSLTAEELKRCLAPEVTVVLATHVFGIPCDMEAMLQVARQHQVLVVEDAAPALGAELGGQLVGRFGDAAIVSFQSTKVIAAERGGALLTNDDELAQHVSCLAREAVAPDSGWRSFGKAVARKIVMSRQVYPAVQAGYRLLRHEDLYEVVAAQREIPPGYVRRCSRFASALVLRQLDRLEGNLARRRRLAHLYQEALSHHPRLKVPVVVQDCAPAWIQFPILADDKAAFYRHMQQRQIDLSWTFRYSCAESYGVDDCPSAHQAAQTVLGLPTYPALTDEQADQICAAASQYA